MMKGSTILSLYVFVIAVLYCTSTWSATTYNNDEALKGVSRANIYFDVTLKDAKTVQLRMDLVDRTLSRLEKEGIDVDAVVGFRGPASRYITTGSHYVIDEDVAAKAKIGEWVKTLLARGVVIEQCSIAADMQDISHDDFLPGIAIVDNGYISLIGYQAQGYAVIPMD